MATGLPDFPPFRITGENNLGLKWTNYVKKFENLVVALNVTSAKRKKALLLHFAGDELFDLYDSLSTDEEEDYEAAKTVLDGYFNPKKNTEFETFEFRQMKQQSSETTDQFAARLKAKAKFCDFADKDREVKSQLIQGCKSSQIRRKALREEKSLDDLLQMARTLELSDSQAAEIEKQNTHRHSSFRDSEDVNKIKQQQPKMKRNFPRNFPRQNRSTQNQRPKQMCRNCGGAYPHKGMCPARGATCNYCHKQNHFVKVCRKRQSTETTQKHRLREINEHQHYSDSETDATFGLDINQITNKVPKLCVKIGGVNSQVLIDTGSSINVVDEALLTKMKPSPRPQKSKIKAYAFGQKTPLQIKAKYTLDVESGSKFVTAEFHVIKGTKCSLLSYQTAVDLGIVPVINALTNDKYTELCDKYKTVFQGLGKLRDRQIKFHIDESVVPSTQPARRIPFHLREKVEQELQRLEDLDVIEKVDGPTPWVSNLVVAPKPNAPNEIRICTDMRKANLALKRERHVTPTIDDITTDLNGSTVFSKVDLYKGFHQLELSEESRNMTVFASHVGLRRYKRLNFGVSVAPEIFQNEIRQAIQDLQKTLNISDDIIVHGTDRQEHDRNLEALLTRLQEKGLTLNKNKCEFGKNKIKFYGYIFSENGISPDPNKVETIKQMERPKNQADVKSFLGMTNYVSRFIPNYSTTSEPLRRLTQQGTPFKWTSEHEAAFNNLKKALTSDQVMVYFDPQKHSELWVDASPVGISGILIQDNRIVSYGSRSLSAVEQRYSQTEREALACVWGCQHFHLYLIGKPFTLITDHKSLESIFGNTKQIQSARLERWRLRLTTYDFKVKYRPGKAMIADYCSRHTQHAEPTGSIAEDYVNFIAQSALPNSLKMSDVVKASQSDNTLQSVMHSVRNNTWLKRKDHDDSYRIYEQLALELTIVTLNDGQVLLRGTRLCIPESLQRQVVDLAHAGHQGRVRCKALIRETCWFPYMDKLVDKVCRSCIPCMSVSPTNTPDPVKPSPLPAKPWTELSLDFCGPFKTGDYFMVVIDDYSRFPVVERLTNISAQTVTSRLESIFSIFGCAEVIKTDNGAPFNSNEFHNFAQKYGFKHRRITPLHPSANGTAEAFMKPLVKAIRTSVAAGQNYKSELSKFLMNYRCTPHPSTGLSPSEIMFSRKVKSLLPKFSAPSNDRYIRERDTASKLKNKHYADNRRKSKPCTLQRGDRVLVKQRPKNKLDTPFHPTPGTVIRRKGSMITVRHEGRDVTRDASHFKYVPPDEQHRQQPTKTTDDSSTQELRRSRRQHKKPSRFMD